jgi:hypothetical protein
MKFGAMQNKFGTTFTFCWQFYNKDKKAILLRAFFKLDVAVPVKFVYEERRGVEKNSISYLSLHGLN